MTFPQILSDIPHQVIVHIYIANPDAFPPFFTHLRCNSTFRLWVVTASSSTAPLYFFGGKKKF